MHYQRLINLLAILVGGCMAAIGVLLLAIAMSGSVNQAQSGLALSGTALLLVAATALAVPFSVRAAKCLLVLALACLAGLAIALTFWPQADVTPTPLVQGAVIAFAVLLVLRVFLGRRGKSAGPGT